jgi:hypothetical protein
MKTWPIIVASLIIAAAILITGRFQIASGGPGHAWMLDKLTGSVRLCIAADRGRVSVCEAWTQ